MSRADLPPDTQPVFTRILFDSTALDAALPQPIGLRVVLKTFWSGALAPPTA